MANRYWVGTTSDWNLASNWSITSGGAGGAGVPTVNDDVFVDGNGFALLWPTATWACNNFTIEATSTELCIMEFVGIIAGNFNQHGGYFSDFGYEIDFRGNWFKDDGTYSSGTPGGGLWGTAKFSGTGKTYQANDVSGPLFSGVNVTGSLTILDGVVFTAMRIQKDLDISGTLTINADRVTISATGNFNSISGTLQGAGELFYEYDSGSSIPSGGTIDLERFIISLQDSATIQGRVFDGIEGNGVNEGDFIIEFPNDLKTATFSGTIDVAGDFRWKETGAITAFTFDFAANNASWIVRGLYCKVNSPTEFQNATFTLKLGNATHNIFGMFDLFFGSGGGLNPSLDVQAGNSTLRLHANKGYVYNQRLSLVRGGFPILKHQTQTYHIVEFVQVLGEPGSMRLVEGFDASNKVVFDCPSMLITPRSGNLIPVGTYVWGEFQQLNGMPNDLPYIQGVGRFNSKSKVAATTRARVLFLKVTDVDFSSGVKIYNWGGQDDGSNLNLQMGAFPLLKRNARSYRTFNRRIAD